MTLLDDYARYREISSTCPIYIRNRALREEEDFTIIQNRAGVALDFYLTLVIDIIQIYLNYYESLSQILVTLVNLILNITFPSFLD